jgi:hypothetical protein
MTSMSRPAGASRPAAAPVSETVPIPAGQVGYLITTAARAPSVHNTEPWRFKVSSHAIELYADPRRKLHVDPAGREMLISCGAALFGLRLAARLVTVTGSPVASTVADSEVSGSTSPRASAACSPAACRITS